MLAEAGAPPPAELTLSDRPLRSDELTDCQFPDDEGLYSATKRTSELTPAASGGDGGSCRVRSSVCMPPIRLVVLQTTMLLPHPVCGSSLRAP